MICDLCAHTCTHKVPLLSLPTLWAQHFQHSVFDVLPRLALVLDLLELNPTMRVLSPCPTLTDLLVGGLGLLPDRVIDVFAADRARRAAACLTCCSHSTRAPRAPHAVVLNPAREKITNGSMVYPG